MSSSNEPKKAEREVLPGDAHEELRKLTEELEQIRSTLKKDATSDNGAPEGNSKRDVAGTDSALRKIYRKSENLDQHEGWNDNMKAEVNTLREQVIAAQTENFNRKGGWN